MRRLLEVCATSRTVPPLVHPNTKIRIFSKFNHALNMDQIEAALADLRLQDQPNISATAKCYKVNRSTLLKRFNGVQQSKEEGYELQRLLSNAQSNALIKYINTLTERGLPPTNAMVRNFAADIAGRQPGPHWMSRWLKAHSKELKSRYLTPIDSS